jgi:hypothetical protein
MMTGDLTMLTIGANIFDKAWFNFRASWSVPVELGVVSPGGNTIPSFIFKLSRVILLALVSFLGCLVSLSG